MKKEDKGIRIIKNVGKKIEKLTDQIMPIKLNKPFRLPPRTFGQKASDWLTKWAGSWVFIISIAIFLFIWMSVNTAWLIFGKTWDPYPFILLNFILSTLAAVQAPIILMSQNRGSQKDRARVEYDYAVNKKAEREIRELKTQVNRIEKLLMRRRK